MERHRTTPPRREWPREMIKKKKILPIISYN
jgi:hypothetical protein